MIEVELVTLEGIHVEWVPKTFKDVDEAREYMEKDWYEYLYLNNYFPVYYSVIRDIY